MVLTEAWVHRRPGARAGSLRRARRPGPALGGGIAYRGFAEFEAALDLAASTTPALRRPAGRRRARPTSSATTPGRSCSTATWGCSTTSSAGDPATGGGGPAGSLAGMPRALITGITGQDGQYLAEFLNDKGYEVFGLLKGQNNPKAEMLSTELPFVELVPGDLQDLPVLVQALEYAQPNEVYNLGAISFVALCSSRPS